MFLFNQQNLTYGIKNYMGKRMELSGAELVSLAGSLAICFAEKYEKEDLRKLRFFFSTISSNLAIIEVEGLKRNNNQKENSCDKK